MAFYFSIFRNPTWGHVLSCILYFYFWWKKVPFLCMAAKTIMSFQWKTSHFKHHPSLTKEDRRDDGENRNIELLLSADFFNREKRSLLILRGEDPFLKSLSWILYKYNFLVNVKGKGLVCHTGLKMVFLSWYFWTLFFPLLHYLVTFLSLNFLWCVKMGLSSRNSLHCKGSISRLAHNYLVAQWWKFQRLCDLEVLTNIVLYEGTSRQTKDYGKLNWHNQKAQKDRSECKGRCGSKRLHWYFEVDCVVLEN